MRSAWDARTAKSTTPDESTGSIPGIPIQMGHTFVFGSSASSIALAHPQNILVADLTRTCVSSHMTISYFDIGERWKSIVEKSVVFSIFCRKIGSSVGWSYDRTPENRSFIWFRKRIRRDADCCSHSAMSRGAFSWITLKKGGGIEE